MDKYGLLGKNISYSFSRTYFDKKFQQLQINAAYQNFDLQNISELKGVLTDNQDLKGLNVTIPFKEQVIPYLQELDPVAAQIGAVNTIQFLKDGALKGHNTDYFGFRESIKPFLEVQHKKALILGTGGASKAVKYGLGTLGIESIVVSRSPGENQFSYQNLKESVMQEYMVIVNCSPVGTFPNTADSPEIPYRYITEKHLIYDLIYNPSETKLMSLSAKRGAAVSNGLEMLKLQAEKAWEIWNS